MKLALIMLALTTITASAKDMTVNDEDQRAILVICLDAAHSPALGTKDTAGIANWCVTFENRIAANAATPKDEPKTPPAPTPKNEHTE
jgi:hypothetical protein